jgi:hypothetical protein
MNATINVAPIDLLALSYSIIPVGSDKVSLLPWAIYQKRRPTAEEIFEWRARNPVAWAIVTGAISGLITLDFDGPAGVETMKGLGIEPHRISGSGGFHADFIHPGWPVKTLNSKSMHELGKRWPGLDIRADGGYVVAIGRNRAGEYIWLREPGTPNPLDILPVELREFLGLAHAPEDPGDLLTAGDTEPAEVASTRPSRSSVTLPLAPLIGAPGHPPPVPAVQAHVLLRRAFQEVEGGMGRNVAGFRLCMQLRDNRYTQDEAAALAATYVAGVPSLNTKGQPEPYTTLEFMASLRSAYSEKPRDPWGVDGQLEADIKTEDVNAEAPAREKSEDVGTDETQGELLARMIAEGIPKESSVRDNAVEPEGSGAIAELATTRPPAEPATSNSGGPTPAVRRAPNTQPGDIPEAPSALPPANPVVPEAEKRAARVTLLADLKLNIVKIVKHGAAGGFHVAHLTDGRRIDLGPTALFISERAVRIAVVDSLGVPLPPIKKGHWKNVLIAMCKLVETLAGFSTEEMVVEWVNAFLDNIPPAARCPSLRTATPQVAFAFDCMNGKVGKGAYAFGCLYETNPGGVLVLKLRPLYRHVCLEHAAKLSQPDLATLLGRVGFRNYGTFNGPLWRGERLRVQAVWTAPTAKFSIKHSTDEPPLEWDSPRYDPEGSPAEPQATGGAQGVRRGKRPGAPDAGRRQMTLH